MKKKIIIDCPEISQIKKYVLNEKETYNYIKEAVEKILKKEEIDYEQVEISLSFVSLEEIRELNNEYRGKDRITDVLSFPQYENKKEIMSESQERDLIFLGDVVISLEKVKEQGEEFEHSFERELVYLFIHSIFHLIGYDHMDEEEKKIMRKKEKIILEELKYANK